MKKRLDVVLSERGLAASRQQAQALILAGEVWVNGTRAQKPGLLIGPEDSVEVRAGPRYVSRGGLKLEAALRDFRIVVDGLTALDVGASTGGFTDCLLQAGAVHVYAVDVGYGQFSWRLRLDPRVTLLEKRNIRYLRPEELPVRPDLATIDVSFISLRLVLPPVRELLRPGGEMVTLVKPQFEAGRGKVGSRGVVRDPSVHRSVLQGLAAAAGEMGYGIGGVTLSPLLGPEGNVEFFFHLVPGGPPLKASDLEAVLVEAERLRLGQPSPT